MHTFRRERRLDIKRSNAIIDALGGTTRVALDFGISHPSVSNWRRVGIPEDRLQFIQLKYKKIPAVQASFDFHPWIGRKGEL